MKFIQLKRNDVFLLLPGISKMASEIDEKVAPCRKMKMILKNVNMIKYVTVENKKNKKITVLNIFQHLSPVN